MLEVEWLKTPNLTDSQRDERALSAHQLEALVTLRVVVSAHDQDPVARHLPPQEVQKLQRRLVRPLQVLEHTEQWLPRREALQELREVPHETCAELVRIGSEVCRSLTMTQGREEIAKLRFPLRGSAP